jgi:single-strand DNA-binding protein
MMNQCNFIGRLGRDPEVKYAQSGDAVCNFSLACSEQWKDKQGNKQEKTEWVNVVIWGKLGEIAGQYLQKASLCYISGKMTTRKWKDQAGNDRWTTEIVAREMKMLSPKQGDGQQSGSGGYGEGMQEPPPMGDDVPF